MTLARLNLSEGTVASSGCLDAVAAETAAIHLYPDPDCEALVCALAEHWEVEAGNIAVGNGSDELILLCALTLGDPSLPGVISAGTFLGHRYALEIARREIREVSLIAGRIDADLFAEAIPGAGIAFLCTPHNPSGMALTGDELELIARAAARAGVPLVVDEAYMEFAPEHVPSLAGTVRPGLSIVALRTFSKAYGLAGARIGYAIANRADAGALRYAQRVLPFRVNRLGQVAALAAMQDPGCIPRIRAETARKRDWFTAALREQGFDVQESAANFVAVAVTDPPAVTRSLLDEHEIAVRDTTSMDYAGHVRISLGTQDELERAVHALVDVRAKLGSSLDRR